MKGILSLAIPCPVLQEKFLQHHHLPLTRRARILCVPCLCLAHQPVELLVVCPFRYIETSSTTYRPLFRKTHVLVVSHPVRFIVSHQCSGRIQSDLDISGTVGGARYDFPSNYNSTCRPAVCARARVSARVRMWVDMGIP
jgi:hypothetical protein